MRNHISRSLRLAVLAGLGIGVLGIVASAEPPSSDELSKRRETLNQKSRRQYRYRRFDESLKSAQEMVVISRRLFKEDPSKLAVDLRWIVQLQMDRGDFAAAEMLMQEVVDLREEGDRERPWQIQTARVYLRYIRRVKQLDDDQLKRLGESMRKLVDAGRLTKRKLLREAIQLADDGLALRKDVLGYEDRLYIEYLIYQGHRYLALKEVKTSDGILERALKLFAGLYGEQHRDYAATLQGVAFVNRQAGRTREASQQLERASQIFLKVLGADHETSRKSIEILAGSYRELAQQSVNQGKQSEAADWYGHEAATYRRRYGPEHWRVKEANLLQRQSRSLAALTAAQGEQLVQALDDFEKAQKLAGQKDFDRAIEVIRPAAAKMGELVGPDNPATVKMLYQQAVLQFSAGKFEEADDTYKKIIALRRQSLGSNHPDTHKALKRFLKSLVERANQSQRQDDFAGAIALYRRALSVRTQRYGAGHWRLTDARLEIEHVEGLAKMSPTQRDQIKQAADLMRQASTLSDQHEYADAIQLAERAMSIRDDLLPTPNRYSALCRFSLGYLHLQLGDYSKAETLYNEALEMQAKVLGKDHPDCAETWSNLGALYTTVTNYRAALQAYKQSLDICRKTRGRKHVDYGRALVNQATVFIRLKNAVEAEPMLEEALEILADTRGKDRSHYARALNNLAGVYDGLGKDYLAEQMYAEASGIWQSLGQSEVIDYARSLDNRAQFHESRGEFSPALTMRKSAVAIFSRELGDQHPTTATGFANLSSLYSWMGLPMKAGEYSQRALKAVQVDLDRSSALQSEGRQLRAFMQLRTALDVYLTLSPAAVRDIEEIYENVLLWKGMVTARQRFARLARRRPEHQETISALQNKTRQLSSLAFSMPAPAQRGQWRQDLAKLSDEKDELERQLSKAIGTAGVAGQATVDDVRSCLPPETALVDIVEYGQYGHTERDGRHFNRYRRMFTAFIVRQGKEIIQVNLGPSDAIDDAVDAWRKANDEKVPTSASIRRVQENAQVLFETVWRPLQMHLSGITTVLVSPDGSLTKFPLAALPGRKQGTYLLEELAIAVVPSPQLLPEWLPRATTPADRAPSLLSLSIIDHLNQDPLPGAGEEVDAIEKQYLEAFQKNPSPPLREEQATEAALRKQITDNDIIHIATHGTSSPETFLSPLRAAEPDWQVRRSGSALVHPGLLSALLLAGADPLKVPDKLNAVAKDDNILTAAEVSELDLTRAKLVVLSACRTGLGDLTGGEGTIGLQRAFHVAGARNVVATLWNVNDASAAALMNVFYYNLWVNKQTPLEAIRSAQLAVYRHPDQIKDLSVGSREPNFGKRVKVVMTKPRTPKGKKSQPRLWAGFVLSGPGN